MMNGLIDMARADEEKTDTSPLVADSKYPYGLKIYLNTPELERLGVDYSDWEVGAVFPVQALVKVTSISMNETESGGKDCCVSLQITHLSGQTEEAEPVSEESDLKPHGYMRYK